MLLNHGDAGSGLLRYPQHNDFRALAYLNDGRCRLVSRRGRVMKRFQDVASSIATAFKVKAAILDGEIVAFDAPGRPAFYHLMKRDCQAVYYAFDIL